MTTKETTELIAAYKAALAAKDQTIVLMADVIDDLRARGIPRGFTGGSWPPVQTVTPDGPEEDWAAAAAQVLGPKPEPRFEVQDRANKLWLDDDEEDLTAALEAGELSTEEFEAALSQVQAFNTTVEVVR